MNSMKSPSRKPEAIRQTFRSLIQRINRRSDIHFKQLGVSGWIIYSKSVAVANGKQTDGARSRRRNVENITSVACSTRSIFSWLLTRLGLLSSGLRKTQEGESSIYQPAFERQDASFGSSGIDRLPAVMAAPTRSNSGLQHVLSLPVYGRVAQGV